MTTVWGSISITGSVQQWAGAPAKVCKLVAQMAPGNTGQVKVGGRTVDTTTSTPGTILDSTAVTNPDSTAQAGSHWAIESQVDANTIVPGQYYFIGTHNGDVVFLEALTN